MLTLHPRRPEITVGETTAISAEILRYLPPLTRVERENVLPLLVQGKPNREIARDLVVSVRTVENHVYSLGAKLCASTRGEIVYHAVHLGLADWGSQAAGLARLREQIDRERQLIGGGRWRR